MAKQELYFKITTNQDPPYTQEELSDNDLIEGILEENYGKLVYVGCLAQASGTYEACKKCAVRVDCLASGELPNIEETA